MTRWHPIEAIDQRGLSSSDPSSAKMGQFGMLDLLGLGSALVVALPICLVGLELLVGGDIALGVGLVLLAVSLIVLSVWLTTPQDLPAVLVERTVSTVVQRDDDDAE